MDEKDISQGGSEHPQEAAGDVVSEAGSAGTPVAREEDAGQGGSPPAESAHSAEDKRVQEHEELARRIRDLEADLKAAQAKADENWNSYLRARADLENYRKRTERDWLQSVRRGKKDICLKLAEIMDNLQRAISTSHSDADGLRKGVEMIYRQMEGVLAGEGISPVPSVGNPFDPKVHDAIEVYDSDEVEVETVTGELLRGYVYSDGEILRAAKVRVARPARRKEEK